ncbi:uncharacterized protein [Clytia hemisphaerica]|uniref:Cnidarian restricted protein n=1 Tax=Clytia hemisphaerica TaxID=252671 RepID=A0A7M5X4T4_9CNID
MWTFHLTLLFSVTQFISGGYVDKGVLISRNYLVDHLPTWSPTWYVSFQVQPIHKIAHWTNVVRFTAGTQDFKRVGDRVPAVFFVPHTTKLHICTTLNNHVNYCFNSHPLPLHQWASVEISQTQSAAKYLYTIRINGRTVHQVENKGARYYMGVNVFRGDNFYGPAPARIRQLTYHNLPSVFKLVRNTIIVANVKSMIIMFFVLIVQSMVLVDLMIKTTEL